MQKSATKKALILSASIFIFCVLGFVGITYLALESGDVIVAHTQSIHGESRETHIWFVRDPNQAANQRSFLLEAGHPNNPWVQDLVQGSALRLEGAGLAGDYVYALHPNQTNEQIRHLMRKKYGWRDVWIGWIFDTGQSYPISIRAAQ